MASRAHQRDLRKQEYYWAVEFVSVIIPVFKDGSRLRLCLELLRAQSWPADKFEIIIADNGSPDETQSVIRDFPGVRFVTEPNGGSYAARNAAIAVARGPLLAFTDADCLPTRDWLAAGVAAMAPEKGAGFVVGKVEIIPEAPSRPNLWEAFDTVRGFPQELYAARGYGATANLFTRLSVMAAVGPFRSDMMSSGDVEWGTRASGKGQRASYSAEAMIRHPARNELRQFSKQIRRQHHGYRDNGRHDSWFDIIRGRYSAVRAPKAILFRNDLTWNVRWRVATAAVVLAILERWIRTLFLLLGRPTLFPRSIKGW